MGHDLRYAFRTLWKNPAITTVIVFSLALGIGANTALFSLIDVLTIRPLPVAAPEQLLFLEHGDPRYRLSFNFSYPKYTHLHASQQAFSGLMAYFPTALQVGAAAAEDRHRASGGYVSGNFFQVLQIQPWAGRNIGEEDDRPGAAPVAMLGYAFWQSRFAGNKDEALGHSLVAEGVRATIVGILPPEFLGLEIGERLDVALPAAMLERTSLDQMSPGARALRSDRFNAWRLVGRRRSGVSVEQASAMLRSTWPQVLAALGTSASRETLQIESAARGFSGLWGKYTRTLWLLLVVVGLVLLIACANIANLLLARANARRREFAVMLALGASRMRLARQSIAENLICSMAGATLGVLLANAGARSLITMMSGARQDVVLDTRPDLTVLAFTVAVGLAAALLSGLTPALRAARIDSDETLKGGARSTSGRSQAGLSWLAVISQVGLSFALVVGATVFARSLSNLYEVESGFDRNGVSIFEVEWGKTAPTGERLASAIRSGVERVQALPGVRAASFSNFTPLVRANWTDAPKIEGQLARPVRESECNLNQVTPDYFSVLGTRFVAGRGFRREDSGETAKVAIVNEAFTRAFFPEGSTLGRRFSLSGPAPGSLEIVGVVKDAKYSSLRAAAPRQIYLPFSLKATGPRTLALSVRSFAGSQESQMALGPSIRRILVALDPEADVYATTLNAMVRDSLTEERLLATVSGAFALLAAILAMVGLYGLMAYSVTARLPEIGIRMALGARPTIVEWLVLRRALALVLVGIAAGVALVLGAGRFISSLLFGIAPADPWILAVNAAALVAVALLAAYLPAWRASRADPMPALRHE